MLKNTKIVSTIGPSTESKEVLINMIRAGSNVFRLNFSHGSYDHHQMMVDNIRAASKKTGQRVAIMQDLQGPKIRVSEKHDDMEVNKGEFIYVVDDEGSKVEGEKSVVVDYHNVLLDAKEGDRIFIEDGKIGLKVVEMQTDPNIAKAELLNGGTVKSRKSVNFPDTHLNIDVITKKDREDMEFGLKDLKPDFIALSFFQTHKDVLEAKQIRDEFWAKHCPNDPEEDKPEIIIKLEKPEALEDFSNIIREVDAVTFARGDLGIETDLERLPVVQKKIVKKCLDEAKPVIIATEMLASMEMNPRPTRAEVSDTATAVYDNADAVMTSGETTVGKYPIETVGFQTKITKAVEADGFEKRFMINDGDVLKEDDGIIESALSLSENIEAKALIFVTSSEKEARKLSRYRLDAPVIVLTDNELVANRLVLSWGLHPFVVEHLDSIKLLVEESKKILIENKFANSGKKAVLAVSTWPWMEKEENNVVKVVEV